MTRNELLLRRVLALCTEYDCGRGIWKRIDENRELLMFLQQAAPDLLKRFGFIEIWLGNQDIFLVNLMRLLELPECLDAQNFPRKWPGTDAINSAYMWFPPHMAKIMALPEENTSSGNEEAP